jgi:uncharacterized metal-binding protein YceD (DUF177 family)
LSDKPELSRPYALDRLPPEGATFAITASAREREALARRFDLVALDGLEAKGTVRPLPERGLIEVEGRLRASLAQSCVVTLEPVPEAIDTDFLRVFARDGEVPEEVEIDPEAEQPEPLEGSELDVGEIVAEELAMALDPHPRSLGADAALAEANAAQAEAGTGAFASLAALRRH